MNIAFTENTHPGTLPPSDQLGFGSVFTDHMFLMDYSAGKGWHDARIVPYGPISLSPAASVLHYGTEVFEGLKAYRRPDGGVQLFRPWENVARLNRSCERLGLPQLDPDDALQAIKEIVRVDQRWVPNDPGTSLYIRPFLYSTDPTLALHGVHEASFVIILSPSGSYFSDGLKPVPIMVETEDVRAVRGGTGEAKCGGNYGAANRAGERAEAKGYSQVLWLDGVERKYVEEGGGMNVMFKINGTVVTPALTGSILRGVTRKSAIELLKSWDVPVEERLLSVDELFEAAKTGALEEAWCIGTAAVISPIGALGWGDKCYEINHNRIGELSQKLYDELTGIQWARSPIPSAGPVRCAEAMEKIFRIPAKAGIRNIYSLRVSCYSMGYMIINEGASSMKAIVTVLGRDRVGIIASVCALLSEYNINILDISQTILEQGYFTMVLLVDISACTVSFPEIADKLDAYGTERGLAVRIQREDIFNAMHRI